MELYIAYGGVILAVISILLTFGFFVRPEQLEKKHREILNDARREFASQSAHNDLKEDVRDMKEKIDKIYSCLLEQKC